MHKMPEIQAARSKESEIWMAIRQKAFLLLNVYGARDLRTILITIDRERVGEMALQLARHQQGK